MIIAHKKDKETKKKTSKLFEYKNKALDVK